ncbi:hypothetical protein LCM02_12580 [Lutimonas saemankumensis]|uniref:hypothetical protein n=1 Tax=Lutimonas saemankumensis TaxID=483016 RepID=UPI001CD4CEE5|nr:hypothetical protein [Lutimonas saemankumensis]MCA0933290.1 hypothetical protein [Lutimonas saemankumensis]
MISFFKTIRKRLIQEQRLSKYILYAIGEILLVVIGILIALQVNNRNISDVNDKKIEIIFDEIEENLIADIKLMHDLIDYYNHEDSLIQLIKEDQVTRQMYLNDQHLFYLLYYYKSFTLNQNGYNLLSLNLDVIPDRYTHLLPYINETYSAINGSFEKFNEYMIDFTFRILERWGKEKSYFTKSTEEKINFYLTDSTYKNEAIMSTRYSQDMFVRNAHTFIYNATVVINSLERMKSGPDFDNIAVYNRLVEPLDTLLLSPCLDLRKEDFEENEIIQVIQEKKSYDKTSIFIKNNSDRAVYVSDQTKSKIEPFTTFFYRPETNSRLNLLREDDRCIGSLIVPKRSFAVLITD